MNELQIFQYSDKQVRTILKNGEPLFVAKDVCEILELNNVPMAVSRLPDYMRDISIVDTLGGKQEMITVTEAGVYKLVFTSRKPEAERFTDWLASEVLPSIRKHGAYIIPDTLEQMVTSPEFGIRLLNEIKKEREKRLHAEQTIEQQKPQVLFAQSVTASSTSILVADLAKILKKNGINIGEIRLWEWLRNNSYAIKEKCRSYNMPTQKSMDLKVMEIKEGTRIDSLGESHITKTTLVTGKGQIYFVNKFLTEKLAREEQYLAQR